ncbi:DUF262 domain-containing protein [Allochromatium vinosum]|uniref:GmrSD restriction endonucleases N-terminal domain-containing protein n=1 Tax=Allochromatium vinosum (strain ATCC 17899 / DSM 180 / NBRC 103801 / NCIMB 10441 / D) TaxID=572477 RepID=D3RMT4_ALLVD|nr:DUF262 domain-containing protein [Allochromatium vinosum]ADC63222.1 protein of unknown function DUF262 [Allochromatium vinosum DSM 180]
MTTSYNGLFNQPQGNAPAVVRIEIPIIQRDYAQGRDSEAVARIRAQFLDAIHNAVTNKGSPLSLDFIYGDVIDGTLRPLDGQQRLTTLFLLHWYLAWRADRLEQEQGWKRFEYATRPSARRFCECLVESTPPADARLRAWFEDQHWFLYSWQHDPTIQSMLRMLEAIHERFATADCVAAWNRLVRPQNPAISFQLLPIENMGLTEDLYIKMNSRGKPLTPFENFKARFEQILEVSCPERVEGFALKVDGVWADLLWRFRRRTENSVDEAFLHYFQFISDVCEWRDGRIPADDIESLAERVYGPGNPNALAHLDFLIKSFDTWVGIDTSAVFAQTFSHPPAQGDNAPPDTVVLFGIPPDGSVDLFAECCQGRVHRSWPKTLLLYAVLLHRPHQHTPEFLRRVRILRNLIEASGNELRADRMPNLLKDTRYLIEADAEHLNLLDIKSFNQAQVADEQLKVQFLEQTPDLKDVLFRLEDHTLLRGALAAFEFDATVFEKLANAFHAVFATPAVLPVLTGALLAAGDYSRRIDLNRFSKFGSGVILAQWRTEILTGSSRAVLTPIRRSLGHLLDVVAQGNGDVVLALKDFTQNWLNNFDAAQGLDWRWYFVKYPEMRAGRSGVYAHATRAMDYEMCMLDRQTMASYYRDPYLSAIRVQSTVPDDAVTGTVWQDRVNGPWFAGYETEERWMRLTNSGTRMRCVNSGLQLRAPQNEDDAAKFWEVCIDHEVNADGLLRIPQVQVNGHSLDTVDRVQRGADLLRALVQKGL